MKKIFLLLFLSLFLVSFASAQALNWSDGLVGYWTFDETTGGKFNDSRGVYNGTTDATQGIAGKINNALSSSGAKNSYVPNFIKLQTTNLWTWNMWVNLPASGGSGIYPLIFFAEASGNNHVYAYCPANACNFFVGNGGGGTVISTSDVRSTGWVMLTFMRNASGCSTWVNGTLSSYVEGCGAGDSNLEFEIFGRRDISGDYMDGNIDELGMWNRGLSPTEVQALFNQGIGLTYGDGYFINLSNPNSGTTINTMNYTFSANYEVGISRNISNITQYIWKDGVLFNQTFMNLRGKTNSSNINITNLSMGNYEWNVLLCYNSSLTTQCNFGTNSSFSVGTGVIANSYNSTIYETSTENIFTEVSKFEGSSISLARLFWNNTFYSGTISQNSTYASLSRTLQIPVGTGVKNATWVLTYSDATTQNLTSFNQTINPIYFNICNATINTRYLNLTFKDEATLNNMNATLPLADFDYYLGDGTVTKNYQFTNNTNNSVYSFCASPSDRTFYVEPTVQYRQGLTYPQRTWSPSLLSLSNSTLVQILYLLGVSDGQYVTFQVTNLADQALSGVSVNATREISGSNVVIAQGTTGSDGSVTFWMNPDFTHTVCFSKSGFTQQCATQAFTQTGYTIQLGGGSDTINNTLQDITIQIYPNQTYLYNSTTYAFGMNLQSSYWDVSEYGYSLRLANGTIVATGSTGIENNQITSNYNTGNQSLIFLDYYYVIDGVYTNKTVRYPIINSEYTQFSLWQFFQDLNAYMAVGIFGIDNFGRYMIAFILLITVSGIVSFKFGFYNPISVTLVLFSTSLFLEVITGIIPPIAIGGNQIPYLITFITCLAMVLSIFRELSQ